MAVVIVVVGEVEVIEQHRYLICDVGDIYVVSGSSTLVVVVVGDVVVRKSIVVVEPLF